MILKFKKVTKEDKTIYVVSYQSGKKEEALEIFEGSPQWNTLGISKFLLDLADGTGDPITLLDDKSITDEDREKNAQFRALKKLFQTFADEINKQDK